MAEDESDPRTQYANWHPAENPEKQAELLLERIEAERFKTLDDPGLHGIKERIQQLGFVTIDRGECCSGHPQDEDDLKKEGHTNRPRGYLNLKYKIDDPRSAQFHDQFRKIDALSYGFQAKHESHGVRSELTERGVITPEEAKKFVSTDSPPASLAYLAEQEAGEEWIEVPYELRVRPFGRSHEQTPEQAALALQRFWMQTSKLINKFESVPINEKLEPWYFAVRSRYGKMELTDKSFSQHIPEIENRSGQSLT